MRGSFFGLEIFGLCRSKAVENHGIVVFKYNGQICTVLRGLVVGHCRSMVARGGAYGSFWACNFWVL